MTPETMLETTPETMLETTRGKTSKRLTESSTTSRASWRRLPAAAATVAALVLSGCASIPSSGPVHQVEPPVASSGEATQGTAVNGPEDGMTPEEVVEGFLAAGQGQDDDYAVARQYLTSDAAGTWRPEARTVVFSGAAGIQQGLQEDQVRVSVDARATIDANGIMQRQEAGSSEGLDVELTQVDGQWRITSVPDGVLVPASNLDDLYRPYNLYFLAADGRTAVPDSRWFADRPGVSTSLVRALLNGPAPYLQDSVETAFPDGTELRGASVPVQDGTATVSLDVPNDTAVDVATNQEMHAQLSLSLGGISDVQQVDLASGSGPIDLGAGDRLALSAESIAVPPRQIGLDGDQLVFHQGGQSSPVPDVAGSLAGREPEHPAMNTDTDEFAALVGNGSTLVTFTSAEPTPVERLTAEGLTPPSIDRHGWVWVGDDAGRIRSVRTSDSGSDPVTVSAPWLNGRTVDSLQISRDGTRALLVVSDGDSAQILVTGINRDDDGRPRSLNEPYLVDAGQGNARVSRAEWISETQFVASAISERSTVPRVYDISGRYRDLPSVDGGLSNLSGGNGEAEIFIESDGQLRMLTGESWSPQSDSVESASFAG